MDVCVRVGGGGRVFVSWELLPLQDNFFSGAVNFRHFFSCFAECQILSYAFPILYFFYAHIPNNIFPDFGSDKRFLYFTSTPSPPPPDI